MILKENIEPEFIIHLGQVPVSKWLQQFLNMHQEVLYIQVGESFKYCNPSLSTKKFISHHQNYLLSVFV